MNLRFHTFSIKSFFVDAALVMAMISAIAMLMVWGWRTQFPDLTFGKTIGAMNVAWTNAITAHSVLSPKDIERMSKESLAKDKPTSWTDADYVLAGCLLDKAEGKVRDLPSDIICDLLLNQHGVRVEHVQITQQEEPHINQRLLDLAYRSSGTPLGKR